MKKPVYPHPDPRFIGGHKSQTNEARDAKAYLWAGRITHIDYETMVCSIRLDSGWGEYHDVPITAPGGSGPRSWSGVMPENNSKVILGWKKFGDRSFKPYIIEYLTPAIYMARDFEPFSSLSLEEAKLLKDRYPSFDDDPGINLGITRLKNRKVYSGDYLSSSSSGSDFILDRDVYFTNRSGVEFRLRDSDQTSILQTINEFSSNAAGYYRRGLIKRNAFNLLPDLYPSNPDGSIPDKISQDNPAYSTLYQFGLIKQDGTRNFIDDPTSPFYPPVVTADGQHISYVVHGEPTSGFDSNPLCYVEDRKEIRHLSDGVMAVTEEGDGFQIDPPYPVFIEDVHGTIVGNDFHSESGRTLYKRVLSMKIFNSPYQRSLSNGPIFEAVDTVQNLGIMDSISLARLYRVLSPNSSNQYAFGVTKEGKVLLYIPKTLAGSSEQKGKSVEASIAGLIKMVVGSDPNSSNASVDARFLGGMNIEIGKLADGNSINLKLAGKIKKTFDGGDPSGVASDDTYNGSVSTKISGSELKYVGGSFSEDIGGEKAIRATSFSLNIGVGGNKRVVAGDESCTVLGKTQEQLAQLKTSTFALGRQVNILAGFDTTNMLVGSYSYTVAAGSMSNSVAAGSMSNSVAAGSMSNTVGAGVYSVNVTAGSISLNCAAGPVSLNSSLTNTITAGVSNIIKAPFTQIGLTAVGFAVAGVPGPPAPALDYLTGLPLLGIPTINIG